MYKENPKFKGSGIVGAIPQTGTCPNGCEDCFFQSGRSYLEPLDKNLPNMPTPEMADGRIVRVNDGNDSNVQQELVIEACKDYKLKFYNTAIPKNFEKFDDPVVLTVNPGKMTDLDWYKVEDIPKNLMFVRIRVNMWNLETVVDEAVKYYTNREVPVILGFMAYYNKIIDEKYSKYYIYRKRTINSYWAITTDAWEEIMVRYKHNYYLYSCGKIEGEKGVTGCARCGNCIREFFATKERMINNI